MRSHFHLLPRPVPLGLRESPERRASLRLPRRLTRGPLAPGIPESSLSGADRVWYSSVEAQSLDKYLLLNLVDGNRSVLDIRNALTAATRPVPLRAVERFLRDLEAAGVVEIRGPE